jgi:hypothetical protein
MNENLYTATIEQVKKFQETLESLWRGWMTSSSVFDERVQKMYSSFSSLPLQGIDKDKYEEIVKEIAELTLKAGEISQKISLLVANLVMPKK